MPTLSKKSVAIASLLVVMFALLSLMGGALYAQSTAGDIPLFGKIQKGFHDPSKGIVDAWHVDYEVGATLPTGARASGTVFHHLETLVASSGTHVAAGGSFPSNNVDGTIFLANAHFTVTAGVAQDIAGADITQIQQGDTYRYNGSNSHWIEISGFGFIPDDTILERMLKIQGNPALGECLSWDGTDIEWSTCATGATTVADGSITTDKLHDGAATGPKLAVGSVSELKLLDGAVTEPKLAMYNRPANGEVIEWDQVGNRMQWSPVNSLSLADSSITEPKLDMKNSPANGEVIEWDTVANRMQWSPVSSLSLADNSITEPKLYMFNNPTDGHVIEWDQATGRMQWTSVGNLSLLDGVVTSIKLANDSVTEPKLAMGPTSPGAGYVIKWDATANNNAGGMDWASVGAATIGTDAVTSVMIMNGTILAVDISGGAIETGKIENGAVTEPKLAITADPTNGQFLKWDASTGMDWEDLGPANIANDSITGAMIKNSTIQTADIGNRVVTTNKLDDGAVTEPKLAISVDPADNKFLKWTGSAASGSLQWADLTTQTTADDSITHAMLKDDIVQTSNIAAGAVTTAELHDDAVTEPKLAVGGTQTNGLAIVWDGTTAGGAMQWAQIIAESVEADAITEPKLKISDDPSDGQVLTWDGTNTIMKWAIAGSTTLGTNAVTEPKLAIANDPVSGYALLWDGGANLMDWGEVDTVGLANDAVTAAKLHSDAVTSSHIVDGTVAESDLAIFSTTTTGQAEYRLSWTGTVMNWTAPWKNAIRLMTTLPSTPAEITAADEAGLIGKISSDGDAVDALYFKAESKALSIRMDDITDRTFLNNLLVGYSNVVRNGLYKKGGAVHPSVPDGFRYLIEGLLDGSNRVLEMQWNAVSDRPGFGTTIYVDSGLGSTSRVALIFDNSTNNTWTSGHLTSNTRVFPTAHDTYKVSFWDALTDGNEYVPTDRTADYLARVVDEQHLLESDGKIISQINDVYAKTAHGSYRGDFNATRGGYAEGDMVTAKGSAATDGAEVIFIAVKDIQKTTGTDLAFPHTDSDKWVEISNGFEEYLYGNPFTDGEHIPQDSWQAHTLSRVLTEYDDDRDLILEFEHTHTNAGTDTTNENDVFTFVEMGPVDRWRTFDAKTPNGSGVYEDTTLANSMCRSVHNFKSSVATFTTVSTASVYDFALICIAKGVTDDIMLIFASEQIYSVNTYIVLR